jgi:hypothetical protein
MVMDMVCHGPYVYSRFLYFYDQMPSEEILPMYQKGIFIIFGTGLHVMTFEGVRGSCD